MDDDLYGKAERRSRNEAQIDAILAALILTNEKVYLYAENEEKANEMLKEIQRRLGNQTAINLSMPHRRRPSNGKT